MAFSRRLSIRCRSKGLRLAQWSSSDPRGVLRLGLWSSRGRTSASPSVAGGAVIHKLPPLRYAGPLRSLMNNCVTDISCGYFAPRGQLQLDNVRFPGLLRGLMDTSVDVAKLRKEYTLRGLHRSDLLRDPFEQFSRWFEESVQSAGDREPNAMTLATATT